MNSVTALAAEIIDFLEQYPYMQLKTETVEMYELEGTFYFQANNDGRIVKDCYELEITFPKSFPSKLPIVRELGGKIPRIGDNHVNNNEGELCLGAPFRVQKILYQDKTFKGFINKILIPYLYATTLRLTEGGDYVFGELKHGKKGLIEDYAELMGLPNGEYILELINFLGLKKRIANKHACPCSCGKRFGKCGLHYKVNSFRKIASRSWFKSHFLELKNIR